MTTALAWIIRPDDAEEGLAFGTCDGFLCVWKREKGDYVSFFHVCILDILLTFNSLLKSSASAWQGVPMVTRLPVSPMIRAPASWPLFNDPSLCTDSLLTHR